ILTLGRRRPRLAWTDGTTTSCKEPHDDQRDQIRLGTVSDQDRALAFYTEKLGFAVATDQPFNAQQRWIELRIPGAPTGLVLFTPDGHEDRIGTFSSISFTTDDIQKTYRELSARGVEFSGPPQ